MSPTARDRQVAAALLARETADSIVSMIEGSPTPRERQVQRVLADLEIIEKFGLPGLPGGPPMPDGLLGAVQTNETVPASQAINLLNDSDAPTIFSFDGQSFAVRETEWKWTPSRGAEMKVGLDPALPDDTLIGFDAQAAMYQHFLALPRRSHTVITGLS